MWFLVQELTNVGKRWGGREGGGWERSKAHEYMKDVLFSIATLSRIENISVISIKRQNNRLVNGGSRQQSS